MDCPGTLGVYLLHGRGYQGLPFPCKGMDSTQFSELPGVGVKEKVPWAHWALPHFIHKAMCILFCAGSKAGASFHRRTWGISAQWVPVDRSQ